MQINHGRIEALRKVSYPTIHTQLRIILGIRKVYLRFVPQYAKLAHPFDQLFMKLQPVQLAELSKKYKEAFHILNESIFFLANIGAINKKPSLLG